MRLTKTCATLCTAAAAAVLGTACAPPPPVPTALIPPIVVVYEGAFVPNIVPPTRLDVVMWQAGDVLGRCNWMGGELVESPDHTLVICEDISY